MPNLYDIADSAGNSSGSVGLGFAALYEAMTSTRYKEQASLVSVFSIIDAIKINYPSQATNIDTIVNAQSISTIVDAYGTNETNNGGDANNLPIYKALAKAGAAIALVNSQVILPVSSGQYAVEIDLYSHYESGQMRLSAATSPGLYIASGHTDTTLSLTEGVINNPYRLIAEGPGRYYVYLNVSAKSQGQTATRALTFIVQVGPNKKANGYSSLLKAPTDPSGVIALPAEEEIIY